MRTTTPSAWSWLGWTPPCKTPPMLPTLPPLLWVVEEGEGEEVPEARRGANQPAETRPLSEPRWEERSGEFLAGGSGLDGGAEVAAPRMQQRGALAGRGTKLG